MDLLSLANEELKRGIDEQTARYSARQVINGLVSAASIAAVAQMFATGVGETWLRWVVWAICGTSLMAGTVVWTRFQSYDVDPAVRLAEATSKGWTDIELIEELVVRRLAAYEENERQLADPWNIGVYTLAVGAGLFSALCALALAVGVTAP